MSKKIITIKNRKELWEAFEKYSDLKMIYILHHDDKLEKIKFEVEDSA